MTLITDSVDAGGDGQAAPNLTEIAVIAQQLLLGNFDRLLPNDDTLLTRGGGDPRALKIYNELLRDPKVYEKHQSRVLALRSRDWKVAPAEGDNTRLAKKAADMVRAQLTKLGFDRLSGEMQSANICGIAPHEIMWQTDGREIVATEAISVEPWLFNFNRKPDESEALFARCGVRILTPSAGTFGEPVPHRKFMFHRFDGLYNNPWGLGLGTRLFWPVFFKRQGIQFWLAFAERFGSPVPVGKYPNNATPPEKATLKAALRAFQHEASLMVPAGMDITLLEAAKSGIDTYERLCRYMDDQIAGILTGQPGGVAAGGQLASAINVNNEVRLELVKADADLISETLVNQLVQWIVAYNMPGAPIPTVSRIIEEPKDLKALAETKHILFGMGFRPTLDSVVKDFGGEYTEVAQNAPALAQNQPVADFAAPMTPVDQAAVDALIASLADGKMQDLMQRMLAPVIQAITDANDHQGALESLAALFPNVSLDDLQKSLGDAMWHCQTLGQLAAQTEVGS
jgi:phage gp29-like protein